MIGTLILVGVLIMVPIVLINLIIAQMTNSYQAAKDNALREWGFSKARLVNQYVRRTEKHDCPHYLLLSIYCQSFLV
jgi:inner membrane protein involved in colicin E2 resistance